MLKQVIGEQNILKPAIKEKHLVSLLRQEKSLLLNLKILLIGIGKKVCGQQNSGILNKLKKWTAAALASNPKLNIQTLIAIPYNPYEPQPYNRWTMRGMIDLHSELKVAKEFWDFLGGDGAYEVLLSCFEQVGIEMKEEIDKYFSKFK